MKKNVSITGFGKNLRRIRKERHITCVELAKKMGVAQPTITGWERDLFEPRYHKLVQLADFFDVPLDELFGRERKHPHETATITGSPRAVLLQNADSARVEINGESNSDARLQAIIEEQRKTIANLAATLAARQ